MKPRKPTKEDEQRRFAEVIVMIVDDDGNHKPARALLDSVCSKSIILKEFTNQKRRTSSRKSGVTYKTYGGKFHTTQNASVGF